MRAKNLMIIISAIMVFSFVLTACGSKTGGDNSVTVNSESEIAETDKSETTMFPPELISSETDAAEEITETSAEAESKQSALTSETTETTTAKQTTTKAATTTKPAETTTVKQTTTKVTTTTKPAETTTVKQTTTKVTTTTKPAETTTAKQTTTKVTTTAPKKPEFDFRTTDLNGNEVKLSDFSDAKIIIINMWEPWCGPCVNEMPELEKIYENYKDKGVVIIGVTSSSTSAEAAEVVKDLNIKYPVIINGSDFDIMQTGYVPTTIVVDSEGSVLTPEPIIGSKSYEGWESVINTYLKSV